MSIETDAGRELADRINGVPTGTIDSVTCTHDPFRNFDLVDGVPWTALSPMSLEHVRIDNAKPLVGDAELLLTMRVTQTVSGKDASLVTHLSSWDALVSVVKCDEQVRSVDLFQWHRFDPVKDQARLTCQAAIGMKPRCEFGELESGDLFDYRFQRYRKKNDWSAVLLRWHGEKITEHVSHRFCPEVVVSVVANDDAGESVSSFQGSLVRGE